MDDHQKSLAQKTSFNLNIPKINQYYLKVILSINFGRYQVLKTNSNFMMSSYDECTSLRAENTIVWSILRKLSSNRINAPSY